MKAIPALLTAALLCAGTVAANAQWRKPFKTNDFVVKYGYLSCMTIVKSLGNVEQNDVGQATLETDNRKSIGAVSAEFMHRKRQKFSFGIGATWERTTEDCLYPTPFDGDINAGQLTNTYITVTPMIRFNWIDRTFFMMYTRLAAGFTFILDKWDGSSADYDNWDVKSEKQHYFGYQISPLGFAFGRRICGFVEIGFGCQGLAQAGIMFKFS